MPIPRLHLVELEDLPWFPAIVRDFSTDYLRFMGERFRFHEPITPIVEEALDSAGEARILDLCSGGGGAVLDVQRALARKGRAVAVKLTDLYPNLPAFEHAKAGAGGELSYAVAEIDARNVPSDEPGLRTLFNAFHHFRPADARDILTDAVEDRRPIAIFEVPERTIANVLSFLLTPLFVLLFTPLMRPFKWSRLFWTYIIPAVPFVCFWDGTVSQLRSYTVGELETLGAEASKQAGQRYAWRAGQEPIPGTPGRITYLVGTPGLLADSENA